MVKEMKDYDVFAPENILENDGPYCLKFVHQKQVNKIYMPNSHRTGD